MQCCKVFGQKLSLYREGSSLFRFSFVPKFSKQEMKQIRNEKLISYMNFKPSTNGNTNILNYGFCFNHWNYTFFVEFFCHQPVKMKAFLLLSSPSTVKITHFLSSISVNAHFYRKQIYIYKNVNPTVEGNNIQLKKIISVVALT